MSNSANFLMDLGVINGTTGAQLTRVSAAPTTGQYSAAAGVYTFAAADTGIQMLISYTYSAAAGGNKTTITNQLMGNQTTFGLILNEKFNGQTVQFRFPQAVANKWTFATKLEDFTIPEFDGECFADNAGNICYLSMNE